MVDFNTTMFFDTRVAMEVGVDGAIMINNLKYWLIKNRANKKHYHDGKYWTYNTISAFVALFPFWSKKQIERILNNLRNDEYIETGNYNKIGYDRTTWYTLTDKAWLLISPNGEFSNFNISPNGEMEFPKRGNGIPQTGKPIPNNIPNNISNNICTTCNTQNKSDVVEDKNKNIELIENRTHLKAMSNNMKNKACKWNTERLDKAIDIFISKEGEYFSLLEKIYKDDKNFVPKVNTKSNNDIPKVKTRFHNINESFRNYPPDELERLLRESQKGKF